MAASRLTDNQKIELVGRYQQGQSSADLASHYGCSPNTVSRVVKAALDPAEYEKLKLLRSRGSTPSAGSAPMATSHSQTDPPDLGDTAPNHLPADPALLAIDDADDFCDDDDDLIGETDDEAFAPIPVLPLSIGQEPVRVQELVAAMLPESLYLLVDKCVELQAKPLKDFTELGQLPPDEQERQALQLFANPRQAKRQCGRSQRVIKMPDPALLLRRASYLQIKGISRLVVEGSLYALPGS